jgi:hypothetical protein
MLSHSLVNDAPVTLTRQATTRTTRGRRGSDVLFTEFVISKFGQKLVFIEFNVSAPCYTHLPYKSFEIVTDST